MHGIGPQHCWLSRAAQGSSWDYLLYCFVGRCIARMIGRERDFGNHDAEPGGTGLLMWNYLHVRK